MVRSRPLLRWLPATVLLIAGSLVLFALNLLGDLDVLEAEFAAVDARLERGRQAAREMRQSSDDLTRMARLYAVTGDDRYRRYFGEILDIRNGESPRPDPYPGIHWDLVVAGREAPRPAGAAASFAELADAVDFNERERGLLRLSRERSDRLAEVEGRALEAETPPQLLNAARELHEVTYHRLKAEIMTPIEELEATFAARGEREKVGLSMAVQEARAGIRRLLQVALVLCALAAVTVIFRR